MFQLCKDEWAALRSQIVTLNTQGAKAEGLNKNRSQFVTGSARYRGLNARPYVFTEQVKRNSNRFPDDFYFQAKPEEITALKSQFATSNT